MVEPSGRCDVSLEPLTTHGQFYIYINGGAKRDRTADLLRARQALSQLSYGPIALLVPGNFIQDKTFHGDA